MSGRSSQNLTRSIVQDLGVAIGSGKYSQRNPFPVEADLCKQYGASRSVLREAVKMLTAKGLLVRRGRDGRGPARRDFVLAVTASRQACVYSRHLHFQGRFP